MNKITPAWEAHTGLDYTVVMHGDETTDNASIRVFGDDAPALAERIAGALSLDSDRTRLFYDADDRTIYDENRLAVARDVHPADAHMFLTALHGQAGQLASIAADMLAYEAEQFDGDAPTWDVIRGGGTSEPDRAIHTGVKTKDDAQDLADADIRETGGYAYLNEVLPGDLNVSGAELVDAFAAWRGQLRAALESAPVPVGPTHIALLTEAAARFREYEAGHQAKVDNAVKTLAWRADNNAFSAENRFTEAERDAAKIKAERNAEIAGRIEAALAGLTAPTLNDQARQHIRDLMAEVANLDNEISQMQDLFPDDDGQIKEAKEGAAETYAAADAFLIANPPPEVRTIFITLDEHGITEVMCEQPAADLRFTTVDYDVEGIERERCSIVTQGDTEGLVAYVNPDQEITQAQALVVADASEDQFDDFFDEDGEPA